MYCVPNVIVASLQPSHNNILQFPAVHFCAGLEQPFPLDARRNMLNENAKMLIANMCVGSRVTLKTQLRCSLVKPELALVSKLFSLLFHHLLNLTCNTQDPSVPFGSTATLEHHASTRDTKLTNPP